MYFPDDMNFQYFFFDTYPGFFLQALPVALIAGGIYAVCQIRRNRQRSPCKIVLSALFVCYITGLLCLTLFISLIGDIYYTARREHLQIIRSISALLESSHDTLLQISPALSINGAANNAVMAIRYTP